MNKIQNEGQWVDISAQLNSNFEQIETDILALQQTSWANKGYYYNEEDLLSTHPTSNVGDRAFVGSSYPYTIYLYTEDGWNNTGETGDATELQLQGKVNANDARLNNLETQLRIESDGTSETIADIHSNFANLNTIIKKHTDEISEVNKGVQQNATQITELQETNADTDEKVNLLSKKLDGKAPKVGYAPDLKVDFAKELVGRGVAELQEIGTIRPTGLISIGDGNATIEKMKGNSVVWNQYAPVITPSTVVPNNTMVAQYTYDQDKITITTTTEISNDYSAAVKIPHLPHISKHKYLLQFCAEAQNVNIYVQAMLRCTVNGRQNIAYIYNASTNNEKFDPYISIAAGAPIGTTLDISNIAWYDLTQMFGAGNEPTTIEEFEARKPLGVTDDYNEGEIISYDGANALQSVGFNAYNGTYAKVIGGQKYHALGNITSIGFAKEMDGETTAITLDSEGMFTPTEDGYVYAEGSDICIHLAHTYTPEHTTEYEADTLQLPDVKAIKDKDGNPLFPYGLLSAGSAHDEITATKAIKRIGAVDMGTFNWRVNATFNCWVIEMPNDYKHGTLSVGNCVNQKFPVEKYATFANSSTEKVLSGNNKEALFVRDSSYTTATDFKAAMSGVMLYYELAEPIEVDLAEPLNFTYDAWDFGTEELHTEAKTTPLNADVVYQFNAVDRIRENTAKNQALEAELAELKSQLTQLTQ